MAVFPRPIGGVGLGGGERGGVGRTGTPGRNFPGIPRSSWALGLGHLVWFSPVSEPDLDALTLFPPLLHLGDREEGGGGGGHGESKQSPPLPSAPPPPHLQEHPRLSQRPSDLTIWPPNQCPPEMARRHRTITQGDGCNWSWGRGHVVPLVTGLPAKSMHGWLRRMYLIRKIS